MLNPKNVLKKSIVAIVFSTLSFSAFSAPSYLVYPTCYTDGSEKAVISTPHYYEFDSNEGNPKDGNEKFFCGHTAVKMSLATFGIYRGLQEIHSEFLRMEDESKKPPYYKGEYDYNTNRYNGVKCPYCAHINLLHDYLVNQGVNVSGVKSHWGETSYFNWVKSEIDSGRVIISRSERLINENGNWTNGGGHFFVIHGYRIQNGVKYLYLRDPYQENGGMHTDWGDFSLSVLWNKMNNGKISSLSVGD